MQAAKVALVPRDVALLRPIDVVGHTMNMDDLRSFFESGGLTWQHSVPAETQFWTSSKAAANLLGSLKAVLSRRRAIKWLASLERIPKLASLRKALIEFHVDKTRSAPLA